MSSLPFTSPWRMIIISPDNTGKGYNALIFSDDTNQTTKREVIEVNAGSSLTPDLLERGGFACRISLKE